MNLTSVFQFHKGAIRTYFHPFNLFRMARFNSIKVRLELTPTTCMLAVDVFQFHKGAIRTIIIIF